MSGEVSASDKYSAQTITWIKPWTPKLFSFRLTRPAGYRFVPGQWARLGVKPAGQDGIVWRAYSIASADYDEHLEFYSIVVPDGAFTSELSRLKVGDTVFLEHAPYGFLTTSRFVGGQDLWLLSTGTGLAPFLSIVADLSVWQQYQHIIIVHGARESNELAYADMIAAFKTHEVFAEFFESQPNKLMYQACVTRQTSEAALHGRIPALIENGALEAAVGVPLDLERSRVMICGNPDMVSDTRAALKARGFTVSRNAAPGQIAVENYW